MLTSKKKIQIMLLLDYYKGKQEQLMSVYLSTLF